VLLVHAKRCFGSRKRWSLALTRDGLSLARGAAFSNRFGITEILPSATVFAQLCRRSCTAARSRRVSGRIRSLKSGQGANDSR